MGADGRPRRAFPARLKNENLEHCRSGATHARRFTPGPWVQLIQHVEILVRAIATQDFEGIVAKRVDAPYRAGRQPAWVKIKNRDYSRRAAVEWQGR